MNPSRSSEPLTSFQSLVTDAVSRRDFVRMGLGSLAVGFFAGEAPSKESETSLFSFQSVPVSADDTVNVPNQYVPKVLYAWGDPVNGEGPAFNPDAKNSAEEQEQQAGMGHDGMQWFPWPGDLDDRSDRGLLVMNHEYTDQGLLFNDGLEPMTGDKVRKSQAAHGVSIIAVEKKDGEWKVVPSKWSRRVTASTPMTLTGPAAGCNHVQTKADPKGLTVLGTFNNCASGKTPWGTYLACEENVHGYFGSDDADFKPGPDQKRYGYSATGASFEPEQGKVTSLYHWWKHDQRFDLGKEPNEANRFGFVVEIDPQNPASVPRKHTALGRIKHENAAVTLSKGKRAVVYMGDDEKNEYIYKFVSTGTYDPANREANLKLLETGTLYVAQFTEGGTGKWLPLVHNEHGLTKDNGFEAQSDISVRTRQAADRAGATTMDRPEWVAVHPTTGKVFVTLTNNSSRGEESSKVNSANPRTKNVFGHIISWDEAGGDAAAETFQWSIFLLAGDPTIPPAKEDEPKVNIKGDIFGSPDGLTFDPRGILWIQTDVSSSKIGQKDYKNLGNNMMLAADPDTGLVRRFLTGPKGCEITGLAFTPDLETMFVNIQHPGERPKENEPGDPAEPKAVSAWPDGLSGGRPRPATVVITHREGKVIGT
ncbi:MAG: PhoX family phosphatase [Verrucomicrobium sp.]